MFEPWEALLGDASQHDHPVVGSSQWTLLAQAILTARTQLVDTAHLKQYLWLATTQFSFWYWKSGGNLYDCAKSKKFLLKPCNMICGSPSTLTSGRRCPLSSRSRAPFAQVVGSSGSTDISHSWQDNLAPDNLAPRRQTDNLAPR